MKNPKDSSLIGRLSQIRQELGMFEKPESKAAFLRNLNELIAALHRLREGFTNPSLETKVAEITPPLEQVIRFLESAQKDDALAVLLSLAAKSGTAKPKRQPLEIPANLTNNEIRELLKRDLSKPELKAIAGQRAISVGKSNNEELRRDILKNLERQEGYGRLASP